MAAIGIGQTALAQEPVEEILVTGSRIRQTSGMETPTPVTVVTRQELAVLSPTNLIEGLAELPQFFGSATTQTPSPFFTSVGAGSLNLRGLQSNRTLQLLDGRRVVPSTIFGGPDINLFPENVIRSVETVTGGASAAYGTDAVAGVVNFVLDTDFEGVRADLQTGQNEKGHNETIKASFGAGFKIGERTHFLFNAERERQDPIWGEDILEYEWYRSRALIENPAPNAGSSPDNPFYIAVDDVRSRSYDINGIFHLDDYGLGSYILDENGKPSPFILGDVCNAHGCSTTNGGSGNESQLWSTTITPASGRENVFGYIEHDVNDQLTVFGQVIRGKANFKQLNFGGLFPNPPGVFQDRHFTIYRDNPFLPEEIRQIMEENDLDSVPFSRIGAPEDIAHSAATEQVTETESYTIGFEYTIGKGFFQDWLVEGYFQRGQTDVKAIQHGGIRLDRIYLAVDVVIDPKTGLPACNVTVVSGLYPDCKPLNLFGRGRASPEAVDWVTGFEPGHVMHANGFLPPDSSIPHTYISGENKQRVIDIEQDVWEISADGKIADGWAGPITMALGIGARKESFVQVVEVGPGGNINADPTYRPVMANNDALGIRGVPGGNAASGNHVEIQFSNVPFARGAQDVKEAFTEFLVPLVSGVKAVQQLNLSAAYRYADYSGSGSVDSWKSGLDWRINDQLRLRATISQDVRAATMGEKFDRTGGVANITDYLIDPGGGFSYGITTFSNGTPDIEPESAKTKVFGIVYQPNWAQGLSASVDWYSVEVTNNINQVTAEDVVRGCYVDNDADLCKFITRTGNPSEQDPSIRLISLVGVPYYNQASVKADGVDFEIVYNRNVNWFNGSQVFVRLLGSYLEERSNTNSQGVKTEVQGRFGFPEWTAVLSTGLVRGPLSLNLTARYTGEQLINPNWNFNGLSTRWDVADNTVGAETLVDARVSYRFDTRGSGNVSLFATINNLFDTGPQEFLNAVFNSGFNTGPGLGVTGDLRGRRYTVGFTVDF